MYQRILAPLKRDSTDALVVEHAGALARLTGGQVTLLHVVHSHSRDESVYMEGEASKYLRGWADRLSAQGVRIEGRAVTGEPAESITAFADQWRADLIVMASHGHSEVRHVLVGSVTEDVVRNGHAPVLLVRPSIDQLTA